MRLGLIAIFLPVAIQADTYPRQKSIDIQHYIFRVTLTDESNSITGETTVAVRFLDSTVKGFHLDLASGSMTVSAVSEGNALVPYTHQNDQINITLAHPPQAGELRTYTIKYSGTPTDGLKFPKNKFGDRTFFSVNWPDKAHYWLPTIDHPYDKATSEFIVTAPAQYQVVANGLLQEETDLGDGRRTTHWKQSVPIAVWLNNIGVAQFASRHYQSAAGVPLQSWVFPKDREAGIVTFEDPLRQSIEFFNDHIGPYPYEKLAAVQAAGMGGGMEHASEIFFGERSVTVPPKPALGLVSHETAHQWFGDSVTESDWDDVWLSEGFATYFSSLCGEHYEGRDAFLAGMKRNRAGIFTMEQRQPGMAVVQDKPWRGIPNRIIYQKGGWTLHMLRGQLGTEVFWQGIRAYYQRYRDSNASTADFERVMEETSGQDLKWFFQQWLYRAGSPQVEGTWRYDATAKKVQIDLTQNEPGDAYRLPIEIAIDGKIEKLQFDRKTQHFEISADKEPAAIEADPNVWLLTDAKLTRVTAPR
jgi:aminopeptidase N